MDNQKYIKKQLAGAEDLLTGIGFQDQERFTGTKTITKVNATHLEGAIIVDTIQDLLALDRNALKTSAKVYVLGYHEPNDGGDGLFIWDADGDKANHNGGTIIDPMKSFPDWNNENSKDNWFNNTNSGQGVWKRIYSGAINVKWFGAINKTAIDDILNYMLNGATIEKGATIIINGAYYLKDQVDINVSNVTLRTSSTEKSVPNGSEDEFTLNYIECRFNSNLNEKSMFNVKEGNRAVSFNGLNLFGGHKNGYIGVRGITFEDNASDGIVDRCVLSDFSANGITLAIAGTISRSRIDGIKGTNNIDGIITASDCFIENTLVQNFNVGLRVYASHNRISNCYFDINRIGMDLSQCFYSSFSNVKTGYNAEIGINLGGTDSARLLTLVNCEAYATGDSTYGSGSAGDFTWNDNGVGIVISNCRQSSISNCVFGVDTSGSGQAYGMKIVGYADNILISNSVMKKNDTTDLILTTHTSGIVQFDNNVFDSSDISGIKFAESFSLNNGSVSAIKSKNRIFYGVVVDNERLDGSKNIFSISSDADVTLGQPYDGQFDGSNFTIMNVGANNITLPVGDKFESESGNDVTIGSHKTLNAVWSSQDGKFMQV